MINDRQLHPVYMCLFCDDTDFGTLIRKATGSDYCHATITLDSSLNNMYSFGGVPYAHGLFADGFVRESIYSPIYTKNRYFTVLVTFVDDFGYNTIKQKIDYFKENYKKFKYNDIGLIQYYFNFKETNRHSEKQKRAWFCSEFVAYMMKTVNVSEFNDIMISPGDIHNLKSLKVIDLGNFTIKDFTRSDLDKKTLWAKKIYVSNIKATLNESFNFNYINSVKEFFIKDIIRDTKRGYKESDIHPYTQFIDWKLLYDEYIRLFPSSDPYLRFDLYELIVRKVLVPFKREAKNATTEIYNEVKNIYSVIGKSILKSINLANGLIICNDSNGNYKAYNYPSLTKAMVTESWSDIEMLINSYKL